MAAAGGAEVDVSADATAPAVLRLAGVELDERNSKKRRLLGYPRRAIGEHDRVTMPRRQVPTSEGT